MTATDLGPPRADPPAGGRRARRPRRRRGLIVLIVALVILLPILLVGGWYWYQTYPPGDTGAKVEVEVRQGWGASQIGDTLADRGVIGSAVAFRIFAKVSGAGPFQAGTYELRKDMGSSAAAAVLERPATLTYRKLALIPGLTLEMIADRVGQIPGLSREKFLEVARSNTVRSKFQPADVTSLEGLTWPDTYYVSKADTEATLLATLVKHFDQQATRAGLETSADPYRTVIIASLIQTEAKLDVDRPLIAAVVENRLRDNMPLQIDATLLYTRRESRGSDHRRGLRQPFAVQHLPQPRVAADADLDGHQDVAASRPASRGRAVQVLRADRSEREAQVRDHLRRASAQRRRSPAQGPPRMNAHFGGVTGETRLAAVIGDPVRHSRSPVIHNAAYAAAGLDWVFVALEVRAGRGYDAVRAVPTLGIAGLSVTMPHKADAARACDELSADATALEVVNTVVCRDDGTLLGDSTDGEGLIRSLADAGLEIGGRTVLMVGAGGAARASVLALGRAGAQVTVAARRAEAADAAAHFAPGAATVEMAPGLGRGYDVVVNATPIGMAGEALPIEAPGEGQWAVDLIYLPAETPFLAAAIANGARTVGGLGMLIHQAALGFEAMTGHPAPLEEMKVAAIASMAQ